MIAEKNYVFEVTQEMKSHIKDWVTKNVGPESIKNKVLDELELRMAEISVSRPTERIHWGIKVPGDESQTIYVWLDALVNYITALGYPKENFSESGDLVHVIGKDIAKFHCVYWPAFLYGAGLPFPRQVLSHGHWLMNKMKMSKSLGNVVDPFDLIKTIGIHSVRSYFLSEGPLNKDANFVMSDLIDHHNKIICDSYGKLIDCVTFFLWLSQHAIQNHRQENLEEEVSHCLSFDPWPPK